MDVELEDIIAYPNPAKETITFVATQTFPMTIQTFRFLLYDINGRIVYKSDETTVKNDGTWTWTWDLRTQNGRRVDAGSYIGRIEIESDGEKYTGKSKKIIVLPQ